MKPARVLALYAIALVASLCPAQTITLADLAALAGDWKGTLTYRDFRSDQEFDIPAKLSLRASRLKTTIFLEFVFSDPGRDVEDVQTFTQSQSKESLIETIFQDGRPVQKEWKVERFEKSEDGLVAVLTTPSTDNNRPAVLRRTITLDGSSLTFVQEVSYGEKFQQRNRAVFERA